MVYVQEQNRIWDDFPDVEENNLGSASPVTTRGNDSYQYFVMNAITFEL